MASEDAAFLRRLTDKLARSAMNFARPKVPSNTLRQHMLTVVLADNKTGYVEIPDYWAVYLHDGRGAFGPRRANVLVYFRNPRNDPRLANGIHPVRYNMIPRLSEAQFKFWLQQNAKAREIGVPVPMIVRSSVGPQAGTFFFDNNRGMAGFAEKVSGEVADDVVAHIRSRLIDYMTVKVGGAAVIPISV